MCLRFDKGTVVPARELVEQSSIIGNRSRLEAYFSRFLEPADIVINGDRPWDIQVHDPRLYRRLMLKSSLGFGEAYMDGWWDVDDMDEMFFRLLNLDLDIKLQEANRLFAVAAKMRHRMFNLQTLKRAFQVAGAGTLITSLWPVEDEAAREWMRAFYRARYIRGMRTAESAREASLQVLKRQRRHGESTHPSLWAGFVASGDWR